MGSVKSTCVFLMLTHPGCFCRSPRPQCCHWNLLQRLPRLPKPPGSPEQRAVELGTGSSLRTAWKQKLLHIQLPFPKLYSPTGCADGRAPLSPGGCGGWVGVVCPGLPLTCTSQRTELSTPASLSSVPSSLSFGNFTVHAVRLQPVLFPRTWLTGLWYFYLRLGPRSSF